MSVPAGLPPLIRTTVAAVTLAPEVSVTVPRMEAAGETATAPASRNRANARGNTRGKKWRKANCAESGMKAPSFPSERKRVGGARTGLLTCASSSHLPTDTPRGGVMQWLIWDLRDWRKNPGWFPALTDRTGQWAGALTVAGQWRSFTAFRSILAIAVVGYAAPQRDQPLCHGTVFRDINILRPGAGVKSKPGNRIEGS